MMFCPECKYQESRDAFDCEIACPNCAETMEVIEDDEPDGLELGDVYVRDRRLRLVASHRTKHLEDRTRTLH